MSKTSTLVIKRSSVRLFGMIAFVTVISLLAGLASYFFVRSISSDFTGFLAGFSPTIANRRATAAAGASPVPGEQALSPTEVVAPPATLTPWDGAGRVTVLLLGLDARDWEAGEKYFRSDTMILLTLDPLTKNAGILSIPRDMWVAIPGFEHGKINTAHYLGDAYKVPGGGPGLAVKTVEQFVGVPINYYAQIDFDAFSRFIDEIGGVKVNVPEKITVDLLGSGSKTKKTLQPGMQVLPGEWALAYARARNTEGGDIDRAGRQQDVIMAIYDRLTRVNMLPTLIVKAPALYKELSSSIHTNLTLDEAIKLALLGIEVQKSAINRGVFGKNDTIFGRSPDDLSILIPIPDRIRLIRDQIFATGSSLSPATPGDTRTKMQSESARVAIYNGSQSPDLAQRTADFLRSQGTNVTYLAESPESYTATTIIDHTGNPYALQYLVALMNIRPAKIRIEINPSAPADIELFLGEDWAGNNPLP